MKKEIRNHLLIAIGMVALLSIGCKKTTTTTSNNITDADGNVYHTITIGNQVWMLENLKTTKYRNGDPIPNVTDSIAWSALATGAYSNYENISANGNTYGRLYNWFAVNDSRKIAPVGWHIPSDAEWTTLKTFLGGETVAGGKLKETGTTHWRTPNTGATNSSGFTSLPGGIRYPDGSFVGIFDEGYFWTATANSSTDAWDHGTYYLNVESFRFTDDNTTGFSVRCIKD